MLVQPANVSVVLNDMPAYDPALALSEEQNDKWAKVMALRDDVNKALELARESGVKKNQDADLTLSFDGEGWKEFQAMDLDESEVAALCIVSAVKVQEGADGVAGENFPGLTVRVAPAAGEKCPRCWNHSAAIGTPGHHVELCDRCAKVVAVEW